MKIIRSIDDFDHVFSVVEYEDEYVGTDHSLFIEKKSTYISDFSEDYITRLFLEGVHIAFIQKSRREDFGCYIRTDGPYLQMHFELEGEVIYNAKDYGGMDCSIPSGFHTLFYFPALYGYLVYPTVKKGFGIEIEITLNYLRRVFNDDLELLGSFAKDIRHERPTMLGGKCFPITPRMKEVLIDMFHCPFTDQLKKIFIEGKLLELLSLQVNQLMQADDFPRKEELRPEDIDRIEEAKKIIENHIENPYSIEELSKLVGINRTKLQKDFKTVYDKTIFGHLADLRMEKAQYLLKTEQHMKISEIARKIGYKNANHFSAAYKHRYGIIPRLLRS
ncbi:AraC family transcriptional regulator [Olivibacter ginsenosidimutans]|uniref:AraC family transcriptional regulator n=1 Tax=Olivibacter ginsenosidimutans TaxID=1176537 RepID=A0ABP9CC43_9SPHI